VGDDVGSELEWFYLGIIRGEQKLNCSEFALQVFLVKIKYWYARIWTVDFRVRVDNNSHRFGILDWW
jgi:hypothetical protein